MSNLVDINGNPFTSSETERDVVEQEPLFNFDPPTRKPEWFDKKLLDLFGYAPGSNTIPRFRVVWGMDPKVRIFAAGKDRLKYVTVIDKTEEIIGYKVYNLKTGASPQQFSVKYAQQNFYDPATKLMTRNLTTDQLIEAVVRKTETEIGSPWWIAEQFIGPEFVGAYFGVHGSSIEAAEKHWEDERYEHDITDPTRMRFIDMLGPFPSKGVWVHWFDILGADDEGYPEYRPLDESVIEMFNANYAFNVAKRKRDEFETDASLRAKKLERQDAIWEESKPDMVKEMFEIKKNKHSVSSV